MFCRNSRKIGKIANSKIPKTSENITKIEHAKLDLLGGQRNVMFCCTLQLFVAKK